MKSHKEKCHTHDCENRCETGYGGFQMIRLFDKNNEILTENRFCVGCMTNKSNFKLYTQNGYSHSANRLLIDESDNYEKLKMMMDDLKSYFKDVLFFIEPKRESQKNRNVI